jgi:hypothetical protein
MGTRSVKRNILQKIKGVGINNSDLSALQKRDDLCAWTWDKPPYGIVFGCMTGMDCICKSTGFTNMNECLENHRQKRKFSSRNDYSRAKQFLGYTMNKMKRIELLVLYDDGEEIWTPAYKLKAALPDVHYLDMYQNLEDSTAGHIPKDHHDNDGGGEIHDGGSGESQDGGSGYSDDGESGDSDDGESGDSDVKKKAKNAKKSKKVKKANADDESGDSEEEDLHVKKAKKSKKVKKANADDESGDSEEEDLHVKKAKKTAKADDDAAKKARGASKKIVLELIRSETSELCVRIHKIEVILLGLAKTHQKKFKIGEKSCNTQCIRCNQTGQKGRFIKICDISSIKHNTDGDFRDITSTDVVSTLNKSVFCAKCRGDEDNSYHDNKNKLFKWFNKKDNRDTCIICREARARKSTLTCGECKTDEFQKDHAGNKKCLEKLFETLKYNVYGVTNVVITPEYTVSLATDCQIDMVVVVTTSDDKKYMFSIEVQGTKKEDLDIYPHKVIAAVKKEHPYRSFMINLNIADIGSDYILVEKLEILRRWVIFGILHGSHLPSLNMWWMFWKERRPYSYKTIKKSNVHKFFAQPFKISHGPKGINSDWEFMSDPFVVPTKYSRQDGSTKEHPFLNVNQKCIDTNTLVFAGSYKNNKYTRDKSNNQTFYNLHHYNIDTSEPNLKDLRCQTSGCEVCAGLLG